VTTDFNELVADAVRDMAEEPTLETTVERAVQMCTESVPSCDMAGVSIMENGEIHTVAASNEVLRKVDELQFDLGEGPCFDALHRDEVTWSADLADDARWPLYGPRLIEETGIRSAVSYRLFTTGDSFGALNLYSLRPDAFTDEDVELGDALAAHTAAALASSVRHQHLRRALETRTVIGQATGMLIERYALDASTAFTVLRRISQDQNLKLHEVARLLVDTGDLPESS
jgi:GAF domain-containing protein